MSQESRQGKPWEERLNEASARFEEELKRVVQYIDKEVVPEVRHHSSIALRSAAEQLQKLAQRMDDNKPPRAGHGPGGGPDGGGTSA